MNMLRNLFHRILCLSLMLAAGVSATGQEAKLTPDSALQRLKQGNARFAGDRPNSKDIGTKRRAELAAGQHPFAVVLACADSRVAPEIVFDQGLGELFVMRVAGNIADPAVLASVQYAVAHLQVPLVVVVGHEQCGAVQAAVDGKPFPGPLGWLVKQIYKGTNPPAEKGAALQAAIRANTLHQATVLRQTPELKEFLTSKRIQIVAGEYSLTTGKVTWLEQPTAK